MIDEGLRSLQRLYANALNSYNDAKADAQAYRDKADAIRIIRDNLNSDKNDLIILRRKVKLFIQEAYSDWRGCNYKDEYIKQLTATYKEYKSVISNIETNIRSLDEEYKKNIRLANNAMGLAWSLMYNMEQIARQISSWSN